MEDRFVLFFFVFFYSFSLFLILKKAIYRSKRDYLESMIRYCREMIVFATRYNKFYRRSWRLVIIIEIQNLSLSFSLTILVFTRMPSLMANCKSVEIRPIFRTFIYIFIMIDINGSTLEIPTFRTHSLHWKLCNILQYMQSLAGMFETCLRRNTFLFKLNQSIGWKIVRLVDK